MKNYKRIILIIAFILLIVVVAGAVNVAIARKSINNIIGELPRNGEWEQRDIKDINTIVLHHTATDGGTPDSFANYHISERGWPSIGYHYVIMKDGTIYQTNYWEDETIHGNASNSFSLGVAFVGNFDIDEPTPDQVNAGRKLIKVINGQIGRKMEVRGHNEFSAKSCPGTNFDISLFTDTKPIMYG